MRAAALLLATGSVLAGAARADDAGAIALPSGQRVSWIDTVNDAAGPEGLTARFRFLAPGIARESGTVTAEEAHADMQVLCDAYALPRVSNIGPQPRQIVISLADRKTEFGVPDPEATQYFEAYRIEDGACIWELF
ncbi:MAG: DUF6497 family protein [Paracoccaceae bacterium]